jgi:hypothetical protein
MAHGNQHLLEQTGASMTAEFQDGPVYLPEDAVDALRSVPASAGSM